jgi:hypothetical protein
LLFIVHIEENDPRLYGKRSHRMRFTLALTIDNGPMWNILQTLDRGKDSTDDARRV